MFFQSSLSLRILTELQEISKGFEGYGEMHNWTHITPFTMLPYFKDLKLPYNIYVMHTEKSAIKSVELTPWYGTPNHVMCFLNIWNMGLV